MSIGITKKGLLSLDIGFDSDSSQEILEQIFIYKTYKSKLSKRVRACNIHIYEILSMIFFVE